MSASETICELSGDCVGSAMYDHKRNHLQILPEHRKAFRGAKATLHIFKGSKSLVSYHRGQIDSIRTYRPYDPNRVGRYAPNCHNEKEYLSFLRTKQKLYLAQGYWFVLSVEDQHLHGNVQGDYGNETFSPKCVIRRMKRLTGNYNLDVVFHDCTHLDWESKHKTSR